MRFRGLTAVSGALLLAGGLTVSACSDSRAADPSDKVQAALKNANLSDVDVNYDRDEKVVHLKGTVDSADQRARAEQIAERAVGTSGKVLNEVTRNRRSVIVESHGEPVAAIVPLRVLERYEKGISNASSNSPTKRLRA